LVDQYLPRCLESSAQFRISKIKIVNSREMNITEVVELWKFALEGKDYNIFF
jgi:hypothetical protein